MPDETKFDQFLDVKGMICPQPIFRTKKAVLALSRDQILKVETTDPGSWNDLEAWVQKTGNEMIKMEEGSGTFTFYIKKI